jgi:hypothetical protein
MVVEDLLGPPLVERQAQRQRIGGRVGNVEELADGRDVTLPVPAVEAFRDVEDEIGSSVGEPSGEADIRLEADHLAQRTQGALHGINRGRLVPLAVEIGLLEVEAQRPTGRVV